MALTKEQLAAAQFLEKVYAKAIQTGNAGNLVRWINPDDTADKYYLGIRDSVLAETIPADAGLTGNIIDARRKYYRDQLQKVMPAVEAASRSTAAAMLTTQELRVGSLTIVVKSLANQLHTSAMAVVNYARRVTLPPLTSDEMKEVTGETRGTGTVEIRLKRMTYMYGVRQGGDPYLFRLMVHPKGVRLVDRFAKSADEGSEYAKEILDECAAAIRGLRTDLNDGSTSIWRFPPALATGCASLSRPALTKFSLAWAKAKKSRLEQVLDVAGNAMFALEIVGGPIGAAVAEVLDVVLAAIGTAVSFLADVEQDQAATATGFAARSERLSEGANSAGAILQGVATILAALALPGALSQITRRAGKGGAKIASAVEHAPPPTGPRGLTRAESDAAKAERRAVPTSAPPNEAARATGTVSDAARVEQRGTVVQNEARTTENAVATPEIKKLAPAPGAKQPAQRASPKPSSVGATAKDAETAEAEAALNKSRSLTPPPNATQAAELLTRRYHQAFQTPIANTEELARLWRRAAEGANDWDQARERFWKLVRREQSGDAEFARGMLEDGGFVFRRQSADGTAPILAEHIKNFSAAKAKKQAAGDPRKLEIVDRLIQARKEGKVPKSDWSDRLLSIDHGVARANEGALLDPNNLYLLLLRDNVTKGDIYEVVR